MEPVLRSVPANFVNKIAFECPSGSALKFESPDPICAMVRRIEFDNALLDECKRGGIEVAEGTTIARVSVDQGGVTLTSASGKQFVADLVIGADGVNSVVAVHSGLRGPWKPSQIAIDGTEESLLSDLNARQDTIFVYYGIGGPYGYGYVFPKARHVNFGIGCLHEDYKRNFLGKAYSVHLSFLEQLKQAGVISGNSQPANFHTYVLPVAGPLKRVSSSRIMLAGDAGGFVNAFTGEGIYYAMVSGEHAGRTALEAIRKSDTSGDFLRRYDKACKSEVGRELRMSVALQKRLLANPKFINSVVRFASQSKSVQGPLVSFLLGGLSYEEMKRQAIVKALPGFIRYQAEKISYKFSRK
jgi:flavin-dependent dehydrogenase